MEHDFNHSQFKLPRKNFRQNRQPRSDREQKGETRFPDQLTDLKRAKENKYFNRLK